MTSKTNKDLAERIQELKDNIKKIEEQTGINLDIDNLDDKEKEELIKCIDGASLNILMGMLRRKTRNLEDEDEMKMNY
jgi:hypothetical protein